MLYVPTSPLLVVYTETVLAVLSYVIKAGEVVGEPETILSKVTVNT